MDNFITMVEFGDICDSRNHIYDSRKNWHILGRTDINLDCSFAVCEETLYL